MASIKVITVALYHQSKTREPTCGVDNLISSNIRMRLCEADLRQIFSRRETQIPEVSSKNKGVPPTSAQFQEVK